MVSWLVSCVMSSIASIKSLLSRKSGAPRWGAPQKRGKGKEEAPAALAQDVEDFSVLNDAADVEETLNGNEALSGNDTLNGNEVRAANGNRVAADVSADGNRVDASATGDADDTVDSADVVDGGILGLE